MVLGERLLFLRMTKLLLTLSGLDVTFWRRGKIPLVLDSYSRLEVFDHERDDWEAYRERLEQLFVVNGHNGTDASNEETRKAILLTVGGKRTYELLRTLAAPAKPSEKSFDQLCQLLKSHCAAQSSVTMRRFAFNSRVWEDG